ncbi:hypothetical protein A6U97_26490 [Agrobacterium tumefaciens]|uniref:hypothetical protein n=1 Tax=Agrobacterium tumefaciens TaxID=358 RepID=UPI00080FE469|nr:hypothetical protein A6U97_26490 [Agrobacterium tumefaciens]
MILETIAAWLGLISLLPWRAGLSLLLTLVASILAYFTSHDTWAWVIFALAVPLGIWCYVETKIGSAIAILLPFLCGYLIIGIDTSLRIFDKSPNGCVAIQGKSAEECQKEYEKKYGNSAPPA